MNSIAMSLAAESLSGVKSRASILVDTSMARTMSMPSVSRFSTSLEERGRARATIIRDRAAMRRAKGRCLMTESTDRPPFVHGRTEDTLRCGLRSLSSI